MSLLSGLEEFGIKAEIDGEPATGERLTYRPSKPGTQEEAEAEEKRMQESRAKEKELLLKRTARCPVCESEFKYLDIKSGRARRIGSDMDLRPKFQGIDSLKYNFVSCPKCGYSALQNYFGHLSSLQIKLLKESICNNYKPKQSSQSDEFFTAYEDAVDYYKLAYYNTVVKRGAASEKAYTCLRTAWTLRGWRESITDETEEAAAFKKRCEAEEMEFYQKAFDGFLEAISSEMPPICGMDEPTLDFLVASMAFKLGKYDVASKTVSSILTSRTASSKIKDRALDLKSTIVEAIRGSK